MNLVSAHIPTGWLIVQWGLAAVLLVLLGRRCAWRMLAERDNLNVFLGASVVVLGLWLIRAGIKPGLSFHLLGATTLTLMFRPAFALFALALVTAAVTVLNGEYQAYAANLLLMGAVPVAVSWGIYRLVDRRLPNHFFVYVFLNAFFGAAAASFAVGLATTGYAAVVGPYTLGYLLEEYLPYYLLMAWSEALVTGMAVTLMVVYKPQWIATFDDRRYLDK